MNSYNNTSDYNTEARMKDLRGMARIPQNPSYANILYRRMNLGKLRIK